MVVVGIYELSFFLGVIGTILLILGIYLLMVRKESKPKLIFGIINTIIGGIFVIMSLVQWGQAFS